VIARLDAATVPREQSTDPRFCGRLRRLVVVSAVMLGSIALLAALSDAPPFGIGLLASGWILMPTLLRAGVKRPRVRYLLALPATLVTAGLIATVTHLDAGSDATLGWWLITAGVALGGGLGMWFWYRWLPVPESLDDPFSSGRIALIATHVALILAGIGLVFAG
jgi:hypothetical protein